MSVRFVNNFSAALTAGIDSDDTTLLFAAGVGDTFRAKLGFALGSDHVYITVYNAGGDVEYMKVTATTGDDFTVVRGQDNTTARAWLSGDMVAVRPNAAALSEAVSLPTDLARSGVNLDITELRGLTTPLSVAQGGTGVASLAALSTLLGIPDIEADIIALISATNVSNLVIKPTTYSTTGAWTHTCNPAARSARITIVGGSGGGAAGWTHVVSAELTNYGTGGNGGGGGISIKTIVATGESTVLSGTIGAGGAGGTYYNNGSAGGSTTCTTASMTALGGAGGVKGTLNVSSGTPGAGGTATGGDTNTTGATGGGGAGSYGAGAGAAGSGGYVTIEEWT